jgi:hypothetical protein
MKISLCTILLALVPALLPAQNPMPGPGDQMPIRLPIYPQLTKYLNLSTEQVVELARIEVRWQQYINAKTRRVGEVDREIRQITQAPSVDAPALGVRYAELEAICREARDTDNNIQAEARKLLNDAQRAKLTGLEQAYALLPVVGEADAAHLMEAPMPGLKMPAIAGLGATRQYPGCRYAQPEVPALPRPLSADPQ